jgi:hypothetical protein
MAKGNHVFNSFDKVIHRAYRAILELNSNGSALDTVSGSKGNLDEAKEVFSSKFPSSYGFFRQIKDHKNMALIHETQDDRAVVANDGNSLEFGRASSDFEDAVMKWATTDAPNDPMESWRQLVNAGSDVAAQESYIKQGSGLAQAPKSESDRRALCVALSEFVKGDLTKLVRHWLLAIRLDLFKMRKVSYDPNNGEAWKRQLNRDVFSR